MPIKGVALIFYKHAQRCQVFCGLWPTELTATNLNGLLFGHSRFQENNKAKGITSPSVE